MNALFPRLIEMQDDTNHLQASGYTSGKEPNSAKWWFQEDGPDLWVRRSWRGHGGPTLAFLPEECHGQRSLRATVHWVAKMLDVTEATYHALISHLGYIFAVF